MKFCFLLVSILILNISCGQQDHSNSKDLIPYRKGDLYGYSNRNKEIIIPVKYTKAALFNKYGIAEVAIGGPNEFNRKYGYINKKGEEIIPIGKYESIGSFEDSVTWFETKINDTLRYGVVNIYGKEIVKPQYDKAPMFDNGFAIVTKFYFSTSKIKTEKSGVINKKGEIIIPIEYAGFSNFVNGIAVVKQFGSNKFGLMNIKGEVKVPFHFDGMNHPFFPFSLKEENISSGLIPVKSGDQGKWGYIDFKGKTVVPFQFDWVFYYKNGYSLVMLNKKWGVTDINGQLIIPLEYESIGNFSSNLFSAKKQGKCGVINSSNEIVIPFKYDEIGNSINGLTQVGIYTAIDDPTMHYGFIDLTGKEVISLVYDHVDQHKNGIIVVRKDELSGVIDKEGKKIISLVYENIDVFKNGLVKVQKNGLYGCVDKTGKEVIPPMYSELALIVDGEYIIATNNNKTGLIDKSNKVIIPFKYDMIMPVDEIKGTELKGIFGVVNFGNNLDNIDYIDIDGQSYFED
ncbi:MAG: WG repeat-containing protein [Flavobacteriia bacterium]|nr:WG repeat-containing protein [Flavobacteriia bacterium]